MRRFKIGKTYETTVDSFFDEAGLHMTGQRFTCHMVYDGDCWSRDVTWHGDVGLWCTATRNELNSGLVVEVKG